MHLKKLYAAICLAGLTGIIAEARTQTLLNFDWKFYLGDAAGAQKPDFNDSNWQPVNVPHDWSVYGPFDEKVVQGGSTGFRQRGIAGIAKRSPLRSRGNYSHWTSAGFIRRRMSG